MLRIPYIYANLPLMSLTSKYKKQQLAWWSLGMTWVLVLLFAWRTNGFMEFFHIAKSFLTGDLAAVRDVDTTALPIITAMIAVLIPIKIALLPVLEKQTAEQTDILHIPSPQRLFAVIMITMACEELLARFFFLELMPRILAGNVFFYLLFFSGNIIWAMLHWLNIADKKNRKLITVLPPFISGIFYTMIFVSHGFFAALCAHTLHNMVLLSANCRTHFSPSRFLLWFYHFIFLGVYSLMFFVVRNHSLSDITLVVRNEVKNWIFLDYLFLVGVLTTAAFLLLELLWYDLERNLTNKEYLLNLAFISVFMSLAYLAIHQTETIFKESTLVVTVGLAVCITFLEKAMSGSGITRLFWKSILIAIVLVIVHTANAWTAIFLFLPFLLHQLGERVLRLSFNYGGLIFYLHICASAFYSDVRTMPVSKALRFAYKELKRAVILNKRYKTKQACRQYASRVSSPASNNSEFN